MDFISVFIKKRLSSKLVISLIFLFLLIIPQIFWFDGKYYVGGDDTMLYYLFPKEMIGGYALNIISGNGLSGLGGFAAQTYLFPFFLLIFFIKTATPFLNTQLLMYGLNLSLGFLFFYLLTGIWIKNSSWYNFFVKVTSSLVYVFSIFSFYTLWSGLTVLYLVSVFPLCFYLFLKSILDKKIELVLLTAIIISIFSILILAVPWVTLALIAFAPIAIMTLWKRKFRFILHSLTLIGLITLYNFYWIFYFLYSYIFKARGVSGLLSNFSSSDYITGAENTIRAVTGDNNLIYPLFNLFHKGIQASYGWQNYKIFTAWHEKFLFSFSVFLIIILSASFFIKKTPEKIKKFYISSLIGWLVAVYFFTIKIGENFGLSFFLFMNRFIPGFTMFRNAYGKISPAMPIVYSLLMAASLKIILDSIQNKLFKKIIIIFVLTITVLNAVPFIKGDYFSRPIWTTKNTYSTISNFNKDFFNLMKYISQIKENSNFIWAPLSIFGYVPIQDKSLDNHYYSGLSPVQFLSGKIDIAGTTLLPDNYPALFLRELFSKNYSSIGNQLRTMNINYLIVNRNISSDLKNSYLYGINKPADLINFQDDNFVKALTDKKIMSFGQRYDLYTIKNVYKSDKIFLSVKNNSITRNDSNRFNYKKLSLFQYNLSIKNFHSNMYLQFLEPFNPYWKLYLGSLNNELKTTEHVSSLNYANGWLLKKNDIKKYTKLYSQNSDGSINFSLILYFQPQRYFWTLAIISGGSFLISILVLGLVFTLRIFSKKIFYNYLEKTNK